ncbi:hypothetical protein Tco_1184569 [Tanacetum coccineum]
MSTNGRTPLSQPMSVVRNTLGKKPEKLKAVKARLNFKETSHHSESGTPTRNTHQDVITKGHPREERRSCHKAKVVLEVIGSKKRSGHNTTTVTIGDEEHSTSALMNFVVVRSPSPYNGFIGRSGVRKLQAEDPGRWSRLVPLECAMVSRPERTLPANETKVEEMIKVAVNPEYSEQTIMIESTLT